MRTSEPRRPIPVPDSFDRCQQRWERNQYERKGLGDQQTRLHYPQLLLGKEEARGENYRQYPNGMGNFTATGTAIEMASETASGKGSGTGNATVLGSATGRAIFT